jgi:hypothetical protein
LEEVLIAALERDRLIEAEYYPPIYFIFNEQTRADRLPPDGPNQYWRVEDPYQFRFRGRPKAFSPDLRGHLVTVRATVVPYHNHLGGYLDRPQVIEVDEYVECPYHDDPYDEPSPRSARVYCKRRVAS